MSGVLESVDGLIGEDPPGWPSHPQEPWRARRRGALADTAGNDACVATGLSATERGSQVRRLLGEIASFVEASALRSPDRAVAQHDEQNRRMAIPALCRQPCRRGQRSL